MLGRLDDPMQKPNHCSKPRGETRVGVSCVGLPFDQALSVLGL